MIWDYTCTEKFDFEARTEVYLNHIRLLFAAHDQFKKLGLKFIITLINMMVIYTVRFSYCTPKGD